MTRYATLLSIILCAGVLVYALVDNKLIAQALFVALIGAAWVVLTLRGNTRFTGLAFFVFGMISVIAVWAGIPRWVALTAMLFALLAWDLTAFYERLNKTSDREDVRQMELAHFARLAMVVGLGLAGIIAADVIKIDITLGSALIFTLFGIWGISALVYRLRSRE